MIKEACFFTVFNSVRPHHNQRHQDYEELDDLGQWLRRKAWAVL